MGSRATYYRNNQNVEPSEVVDSRFTVIEHLTSGKTKKNRDTEIKKLVEKQDKDVRLLAYKVLVEQFNKKYTNLNNSQKNLLKEYINNVNNTPIKRNLYKKFTPNNTKEIILDAGHCPHDEIPELVNQHILDWVSSL